MADIKLVTFDLDNTLWNVETVLRNAEARMRAWLDERIPGFQTRFPMEVMAELRNAVLEENPSLRHDLSALQEPLRSHGGLTEQAVPFIVNRVMSDLVEAPELRNFDALQIAAMAAAS